MTPVELFLQFASFMDLSLQINFPRVLCINKDQLKDLHAMYKMNNSTDPPIEAPTFLRIHASLEPPQIKSQKKRISSDQLHMHPINKLYQ